MNDPMSNAWEIHNRNGLVIEFDELSLELTIRDERPNKLKGEPLILGKISNSNKTKPLDYVYIGGEINTDDVIVMGLEMLKLGYDWIDEVGFIKVIREHFGPRPDSRTFNIVRLIRRSTKGVEGASHG